ncbi:MAG: fibrobacter succinogenes major paralogous domain-containing protein, partial [Sedimentisphaerales bacterium]|nr:fibrobacter succinogenes major paralogous domain-containing protein [Sedimentisphaerales bacterium]
TVSDSQGSIATDEITITITSSGNFETGTVTGNDGTVYKTVKIGNQWWMAENLKETKYRDGSEIRNVINGTEWAGLTTGAYCAFNNDETNADAYGYLYNWDAVADSRNIAPAGWHVPIAEEWQNLVDYLGGSGIAGGKMKETGTTHWHSPNTGATNESGFSALPGGYRNYDGIYYYIGYYAAFWSFAESDRTHGWYCLLYGNYSKASQVSSDKQSGFSLRCLRD